MTVHGAPRGEQTPLGAVHRRPQQKAGEICALGLALVLGLVSVAQPAAAADPPLMRAGRIEGQIRLDGALDGALDEPAWQQAGVIPDLTQQDPHPGEATPFATEVRVLVDASAIYIGFVCHDPDPSRIAIHTMQRDGNMRGDDTLTVVLDPIADGRRGYFFEINAAAARLDGLISGAEDMSTDWDGIWGAATRRTSDGWSAEIRIPAQTLRFRWGQDHWGFNVQRYVARNLTTLRWSGITLDANLIDLQRAGRLVGVGALRQGLGLSLAPYGLIRTETDLESDERTVKGEAGGDLTWSFTGDLTGYLTINPDFAETEIDSDKSFTLRPVDDQLVVKLRWTFRR
ncbi:MAG: carbohydrate binding family 9 domain-containing protein [Thermoanaerobaculales bacterium]